MKDTVFCPCPPGDLPFQKRFIAALLVDCIPVVLCFNSALNGSCAEGSGSHWKEGGPPWQLTYPFARVIDYPRAVVEIEPQKVGDLVERLAEVPEAVIRAKLDYIAQIRSWLVYDYGGTVKEDAFSSVEPA